ncbi:hypothetical protein CEXT_421941 [Caerostris extrusa]|uniref:Uncharacterized protein n=1 Tax=Caerostris extrusa TaxID=172846 RepID=A0AAV4NBG4_CAEEX|nr:hypothetical protein CEXT_421941 [Caerostris extrusa]
MFQKSLSDVSHRKFDSTCRRFASVLADDLISFSGYCGRGGVDRLLITVEGSVAKQLHHQIKSLGYGGYILRKSKLLLNDSIPPANEDFPPQKIFIHLPFPSKHLRRSAGPGVPSLNCIHKRPDGTTFEIADIISQKLEILNLYFTSCPWMLLMGARESAYSFLLKLIKEGGGVSGGGIRQPGSLVAGGTAPTTSDASTTGGGTSGSGPVTVTDNIFITQAG